MTTQIPEEVLTQIFSHFQITVRPPHDGVEDSNKVKTMRSLSLSSKIFHRVIHPFLYHAFSTREPGDESIDFLLETLSRRPENAGLIHECHNGALDPHHLDYSLYDENDNYNFRIPLRPATPAVITMAENVSVEPNLRRCLLSALHTGNYEAKWALLVLACPQLEVLELGTFQRFRNRLTLDVLQSFARAPPANNEGERAGLREVGVYNHHREDSTSLSSIGSLFAISSLRSLRGVGVDISDVSASTLSSSNITQLSLQTVSLSDSGLRYVISSCPHLEELQVTWGLPGTDHADVDFESAGHTFRTSAPSLRRLEFMPDDMYGHFDVIDVPYRPIGSLKEFRSLSMLQIPVQMLFGARYNEDGDEHDEDEAEEWDGHPNEDFERRDLVEILPSSLEVLKFPCFDSLENVVMSEVEVAAQMLDRQLVVIMKDPAFETLRDISIQRWSDFSEDFLEDLEELGWEEERIGEEWMALRRLARPANESTT